MRRYLLARLLLLLPTVFGVVTAVFFIIHLVPGDPVEIMLGETATVTEKDVLRKNMGLDRPIQEQYFNFLAGLAKGDLGVSIKTREPVLGELLSRWPATLELALAALLLASVFGVSAGVLSAARKNGVADKFSLAASLVGVAMPNFWLGPVLIIIFSIWLGWTPVSGRDGFSSLILPAVTLSAGMAALILRITRSSVLEAASEDYIRSARARGLPEWKVFAKHALSNGMIPVITVMGLQLGALLSGAVITETIFSWPGVGRLLVEAIESRDYPLVQACVLNIALCYVVANLIVDFAYAAADPRVRVER